ncbi:hypothetical protein [Paenibacillus rigui]|uniref:Uncharacterized protein n=1 Tax=Paenibacillus rigui TaxID=554312 RepID=A0A229UK57_9BACL|nr:hypothetical protein [Paenibacillus rigui]OXM83684.1 hypothetical protein CF651_24100 [Paenibacillus rigui]
MSTNNRGRNPEVFDEQLILRIIDDCKRGLKLKGKIKYMDVYRFASDGFNNGKYPYLKRKLSDDYWRKPNRQGKQLVDKVNAFTEEHLPAIGTSESNEILINTEDAVNRLFSGSAKDKNQLINTLRINEMKAKQFFSRLSRIEKELQNEREQKLYWKNRFERIQTIIFQLMEYSASKDFPIENIMNTGRTRTKPVTNILESVFSNDPTISYEFESYIVSKSTERNDKV